MRIGPVVVVLFALMAALLATFVAIIATRKNKNELFDTGRFHLLGNGNNRDYSDDESSCSSSSSSSSMNASNNNEHGEGESNETTSSDADKTSIHTQTQQPQQPQQPQEISSSDIVIIDMSNDTQKEEQQQQQQQQHQEAMNNNNNNSNDNNTQQPKDAMGPYYYNFTIHEVAAMKQRLAPREIVRFNDDDYNNKPLPHQVLHLHHMKTGGTSMDGLIRCGLLRLKRMKNNTQSGIIPYAQIHECGPRHYKDCRSGKVASCLKSIQDASVMSYCAPLQDLPIFGWTNENDNAPLNSIGAITEIRHPVARVWSMYRFQTKTCYQCRSLQEVYRDIDNNGEFFQSETGQMCANQLTNHLTRNLASPASSSSSNNNNSNNRTSEEVGTWAEETPSDDYVVQDAIDNLNSFFTIVGLTEQLDVTARMIGMVFPWLAKSIDGSQTQCPLPRSNVSPQNNGCGPRGTHMPLPDYPDDATVRLIEQHNHQDMQIYQAAAKRFVLQKEALGIS